MRRRTRFCDMSPGHSYELDVLVVKMEQKVAKNDKPFVEFTMSDGETCIKARMFNAGLRDMLDNDIVPEALARATITVGTYNDKINYIVGNIWFEFYTREYYEEFLPKPTANSAQYFGNLIALIRLSSGPPDGVYAPIGRLAERVLISNKAEFCHSAGGLNQHHARIGGLLEHSFGVAQEAARFADFHPEVNRELLVTGASLHDIGKIRELSTSECGNIEYAADKELLGGHPRIGMAMIEEEALKCDLRFNPNRVVMLQNIVGRHHISHNTVTEKLPEQLEIRVVQLLDALDASIDAMSSTRDQQRTEKALDKQDNTVWDDYEDVA